MFLLLDYMSSSYILNTNHLLNIYNIHISLPNISLFVACLLIFLMVSFNEKLLILLKSKFIHYCSFMAFVF